MVAPTKTSAPSSAPAANRLAAVQEMARLQRILFEVEREFVRTATTLIYRVGEPELKFLLCQHVWESAGHARFLRERGRELSGFGNGESVRDSIRRVFTEAVMPAEVAAAPFAAPAATLAEIPAEEAVPTRTSVDDEVEEALRVALGTLQKLTARAG